MRRHTAKNTAIALGLSLSLSAAIGTPAFAEPAPLVPLPGAVVGLAGTAHLWIADTQGMLHWAGDTRALAGRSVQWGNHTEVSLDQLRLMQRGDPWLTAGLLKSGDPIYFVKWETSELSPQLLHILSIADVELFGINSANYGALILDSTAWRLRYAIDPATLTMGTLPSATGVTPAVVAPAMTLVVQRMQQYASGTEIVHQVDLSGAASGTRLQVSGTFDRGDMAQGSFGPEDAGPISADGTLIWRRTHPAYTGARYTFTDPSGYTVTAVFAADPV